ncbi:MAG: hypothetical protein ACI8QZ_003816 [Chlamydiales bacterium]|jgi:hypothetical protein
MKLLTRTTSLLLLCLATESLSAQTIDMPDYWPLAPGYSWKGVAPGAMDPCTASSPLTWDVTPDVHPAPACPAPAFLVGPDPDNAFCVENTGGVFTFHGYYASGTFIPGSAGSISMGVIADGFSFQVEPTIWVMIRDWSKISHADKVLYDIDLALPGVIAWVWYDTNFGGGNDHHPVMESGLPGGTSPPAGNITDIDWFVKDVGFHAYMDVGAGTGDPWPPVIDLFYHASFDCNGNGIVDRVDIAMGTSLDLNLDCLPDECACVSYCASLPNATGSAALLTCSGDPGSSLVLTSTPVPNTTGQFFYGPMMLAGGSSLGDGLRCVGGATTRILPFVSAGMMMQAANTASISLNYTAPYASGLTGTQNFQYWFRSGLGTGTGSNTSNAIAVTF